MCYLFEKNYQKPKMNNNIIAHLMNICDGEDTVYAQSNDKFDEKVVK
jgi:hypothetical protein